MVTPVPSSPRSNGALQSQRCRSRSHCPPQEPLAASGFFLRTTRSPFVFSQTRSPSMPIWFCTVIPFQKGSSFICTCGRTCLERSKEPALLISPSALLTSSPNAASRMTTKPRVKRASGGHEHRRPDIELAGAPTQDE